MDMICFELKKIFEKKMNVIAMVVGFVIMGICVVSFINDVSKFDPERNAYVEGVEGVFVSQRINESRTDYLTEDYFKTILRELKNSGMKAGSDAGYINVVRHQNDIFGLIAKNQTEYGVDFSWEDIDKITDIDNYSFYDRRIERLESFLNKDFTFGNYSEAEKDYWMTKAEQVSTPFKYGDKTVSDMVYSLIGVGFYLMLVVAICIAPIFASEYESGAAALLLTTKKGKTKLIAAKVLAALIFTIGYLAIGIGAPVAVVLGMFGTIGFDLPLQLWNPACLYDISIGEACLIEFGLLLLVTLTVTLFTLCVSARIRGSIATLVVNTVILIVPMFLGFSKYIKLYNQIIYLLPLRAVMVKDVLSTMNGYQFGNVIFSYIQMIIIVYVIIALVSLLGIKGGFAKYQVNK